MKIGIITLHRACNYGAVLQAYALSTFLSMQGHDVEIVDYNPPYLAKEYGNFPFTDFATVPISKKLRYIASYFVFMGQRIRRRRAFERFLKDHLRLSPQEFTGKNGAPSGYDVIIFGSDQIWNKKITDGSDAIFTGNFPKGPMKFYSYSASAGWNNGGMSEADLKALASRFEGISVREKSLKDAFVSAGVDNVRCDMDPVFLLDEARWKTISKSPQKKGGYVLLYTVKPHPALRKIASKIASEKGLDLMEVTPRIGMKNFTSSCRSDVSPNEFIGYFADASFVVTTSFHGTAFSAIFHKPFISVTTGSGTDERIVDLLGRMGLADRAVKADDPALPADDPDFGIFEKVVESAAASSKEFFDNILI